MQRNIITLIQQQNNMTPKFPCEICAKAAAKNHSASVVTSVIYGFISNVTI